MRRARRAEGRGCVCTPRTASVIHIENKRLGDDEAVTVLLFPPWHRTPNKELPCANGTGVPQEGRCKFPINAHKQHRLEMFSSGHHGTCIRSSAWEETACLAKVAHGELNLVSGGRADALLEHSTHQVRRLGLRGAVDFSIWLRALGPRIFGLQ